MKVSILLATWLSYSFLIATAINYPTVTFTTDLGSVGSYQTFMTSLRNNLQSGSKSHDIAVLRKPSQITNQNMFLLVELINYDKQLSITVAVSVVNVYVIAFKSGTKSFFLKDAPRGSEALLFDRTTKEPRLTVSTNYNNLGDRTKVGLGIKALGGAIEILNKFDGKSVDAPFKESLLVVIQMIAEASRFKFIELQIENKIIDDEYLPKWDTISFENRWDKLSEQIQLSGTDGIFKTPVQLQNADRSAKVVSNVAQVKSDVTLMLYHGSGERVAEEKFEGIAAEEVVKEWLEVL
ncbi:ribosome-inactivating protein cucurmosin-like [Euphorbia lathyris]|uniref:ribosome-inactivating protein cucurmosin-like n=1 Tax=Euphorbia lathyris TaxID=212925 RepID=UPI003313DFA9